MNHDYNAAKPRATVKRSGKPVSNQNSDKLPKKPQNKPQKNLFDKNVSNEMQDQEVNPNDLLLLIKRFR